MTSSGCNPPPTLSHLSPSDGSDAAVVYRSCVAAMRLLCCGGILVVCCVGMRAGCSARLCFVRQPARPFFPAIAHPPCPSHLSTTATAAVSSFIHSSASQPSLACSCSLRPTVARLTQLLAYSTLVLSPAAVLSRRFTLHCVRRTQLKPDRNDERSHDLLNAT